jgi:hypothetical protein
MKKYVYAFLALMLTPAAPAATVNYQLRISNAAQHTAEVSARFPASAKADPIVVVR